MQTLLFMQRRSGQLVHSVPVVGTEDRALKCPILGEPEPTPPQAAALPKRESEEFRMQA